MALSSSPLLDLATVVTIFFIIVNKFAVTLSASEHNPSDGSVASNDQDITTRKIDQVDGATFENPQHDRAEPPAGHLQPLGSHRPPEKNGVDVLDIVPDPLHFFDNYVKKGKPVLFRGAAKNMLAYKLWSDEYLR